MPDMDALADALSHTEILIKELEFCLTDINGTIESMKKYAAADGIDPYELRNRDGSRSMSPLLVSKAQVLSALVMLTTI